MTIAGLPAGAESCEHAAQRRRTEVRRRERGYDGVAHRSNRSIESRCACNVRNTTARSSEDGGAGGNDRAADTLPQWKVPPLFRKIAPHPKNQSLSRRQEYALAEAAGMNEDKRNQRGAKNKGKGQKPVRQFPRPPLKTQRGRVRVRRTDASRGRGDFRGRDRRAAKR